MGISYCLSKMLVSGWLVESSAFLLEMSSLGVNMISENSMFENGARA